MGNHFSHAEKDMKLRDIRGSSMQKSCRHENLRSSCANFGGVRACARAGVWTPTSLSSPVALPTTPEKHGSIAKLYGDGAMHREIWLLGLRTIARSPTQEKRRWIEQ